MITLLKQKLVWTQVGFLWCDAKERKDFSAFINRNTDAVFFTFREGRSVPKYIAPQNPSTCPTVNARAPACTGPTTVAPAQMDGAVCHGAHARRP